MLPPSPSARYSRNQRFVLARKKNHNVTLLVWYFPLHSSGLKQHHKANISFSCALLIPRFRACQPGQWDTLIHQSPGHHGLSHQSRGHHGLSHQSHGHHGLSHQHSEPPHHTTQLLIILWGVSNNLGSSGEGEEKPFIINQHICPEDCKFMRWQYLQVFALCQEVPRCPQWKQYPCLMPVTIPAWNPLHSFCCLQHENVAKMLGVSFPPRPQH